MKCALMLWMLSVGRGGTERMGAELANALAARGHELIIFTRDHGDRRPVYPLHPAIKLEFLGEKSLHHQPGIAEARRVLLAHRPQVAVGFESSAHLIFAAAMTRNTGIPLILSENSDATVIENERWNRPDRLSVLAGADRIHLLTEEARQTLPHFLRPRATVIPNATPLPAYEGPENRQETGPFTICAVGRLADSIKQQSILIRAFGLLRDTFPHWRLCFYGKDAYGEQAGLETLARQLGLADRVFFCGEVEDVRIAYEQAHIFCLPSRYEGFPMVGVEALRHSLPVVAFAGCAAARNLVDSSCGALAKNMTSQCLAETLLPLMANAALRRSMGKAALEKSRQYSPERILPQWEDLLLQTAVTIQPAAPAQAALHTAYGRWNTVLSVYTRLLQKSGLFDSEWYRKTYVRGPEYMPPLEHFLRFGADKGYWPNPTFDTAWYQQTHMRQCPPELNPLLHYLMWGRRAALTTAPGQHKQKENT